MTNLPSKRGLSSFLGDLLLKSGDDSGKTVVAREGFSKRLCLFVDDLVQESSKTSDTIEGSSSDDKISLDVDSKDFNAKEPQGETNAVDMLDEPSKGDNGNDVVKEMCEKDSNMTVFASQTDAVTGEDLDMAVFSSSNGDLLLSNSQTIKSFSMNRCSNVDGMGIVNHNIEADDDLKSCSCSFCMKAAYIWSDLHYQDIKGRLSVLEKSQREASSLIRRNDKEKPTDIYGSKNFMGQWTSLFRNMEGILASESNHLKKSFVVMKEFRDNCKIDLERATKTP